MHGFRVGVAILLSAWLAACAARPVPVRAASPPLPVKTIPSPACNLEGCCAGHGEVAYLQPDRFVMCTDGEASRICDCH